MHVNPGFSPILRGGEIYILRVYVSYQQPTVIIGCVGLNHWSASQVAVLDLVTYFLQEWKSDSFCPILALGWCQVLFFHDLTCSKDIFARLILS
jgi:hypothetical protein